MKKSPLKLVQERFETKEKLVQAVQQLATAELWIDRLNDEKGLSSVSNAKLLRLHDVLDTVKKLFGSREALIAAILEVEKRAKDEGYRSKLAAFPTPRLLDLHNAAKARGAETVAKPAAKKKVARSKKAQAKAKG